MCYMNIEKYLKGEIIMLMLKTITVEPYLDHWDKLKKKKKLTYGAKKDDLGNCIMQTEYAEIKDGHRKDLI